ncbi:MAG TPA: hypothetical protein VMH28_23600 [Candidatus Acidoferrales bacterium]|nr:hypothetical protein [Candidatus Acidoferrales bacterium]
MKRLFLASLLLAATSAFGQISVGVSIGPPPPPRVLKVRPAAPGPDYMWVEGYWYPVNGHYRWHEGYWTRPPYAGAHWVVPHHEGGQWHEGYWEGEHGRVRHEHAWDREHERDYHHDHDHDHH